MNRNFQHGPVSGIGVKSSVIGTSVLTKSSWQQFQSSSPRGYRMLEELVLWRPDLVELWCSANIRAGATLLALPTGAANLRKLTDCGIEGQCAEINQRAATIARKAVLHSKRENVAIAGVIEPFFLDDDFRYDVAVEPVVEASVYHPQIRSLIDAEIDVLLIENVLRVADLRSVLRAVRDVGADWLPLIVSVAAYGSIPTLLTGDLITTAFDAAAGFNLVGFGIEIRFDRDKAERTFEIVRHAIPLPLLLSVDVQHYQEDSWSRAEALNVLVMNRYERCLTSGECWLIGGGRGTTFDDVAQYRALVDAI